MVVQSGSPRYCQPQSESRCNWHTHFANPTDRLYAVGVTDLTIDDATLNAAERLFGVRYTDAERAQMRDNLAQQVEFAVRRRAVKLPNALPPATLFDPRLPGFAMPAQSALNIPRSVPALPEADEDIAFAPVRHLSAWIAGNPVDVLATNFNKPDSLFQRFPRKDVFIAPSE